MALLLFD